jgi:polygalacturonase
VVIRPLSAKINYELKENTIEIILEKPQFLSIELNGGIENPLLLFANAPETDVPKPGDCGVVFFEAGKIHEAGVISLQSGQTAYLAPGAIVYGAITAERAENIRVCGRGILSGAQFKPYQGLLEFRRVKNASIEGITFVDSKNWTMPLLACENIDIQKIKIATNTGMDDGIDIVGSCNINIENCFIRSKDDCIAIKAGITYYGRDYKKFTSISVKNITVKNSVVWNGKHGNALEIGFELLNDSVTGVVFENIDIIHAENPGGMDEGALTIHNSGRATVKNILYKDIRIEDAQRILFDFKVLRSVYSDNNIKLGKIQDIRMEDITVTATRGPLHSVAMGFDSESDIQNVQIKNLSINGKKIYGKPDFTLYTNNHVTGIRYE